ncbi:MAG: glycosyltransferase family 2 protein [bacterium]
MQVSVVIPAYNEAKNIGACLDAINAQTVKADEIIVVDNNSTDATAEIARAKGARVITEKVQGITAARTAGFEAAQYEIIARTDSDTIVNPDWIEKIHHYMESGIEALTGAIYYDVPLMDEHAQIFEAYQQAATLLFGHTLWTGPNMILTKALWDKAKHDCCTDDKKVHEDVELSMACARYTDIIYKRDVAVHSSSRRMRYKPASFFIEYQLRAARQLFGHKVRQSKEASDEFRQDFLVGIDQGKHMTDDRIAELRSKISDAKQFTKEVKVKLEKALKKNPTEAFRNLMEKIFMEMEKN